MATAIILSGSPVPAEAPAGNSAAVVTALVFADQQPSSPPAQQPRAGAPAPEVLPVATAAPAVAQQVGGTETPAPPAPAADSEIVVTGRSRRGDPLAPLNAESFEVTQTVDKAVVGPVADAYKDSVPKSLRKALRNFLANLREPVVAANFLLQLKPGKAGETLGRFAINTTIGAAGLIDVAKRKPFNLPRRRNGFANTLGYYGVKPGPFFFLPLIGPTTLRDFVGNTLDQTVGPLSLLKPFNQQTFIIPAAVVSALDYRVEFDEEIDRQRATADPYAASRKYYLEKRQAEIDALRGVRAPASSPPEPIKSPPAEGAPSVTSVQ